jgi:hypothetical protein
MVFFYFPAVNRRPFFPIAWHEHCLYSEKAKIGEAGGPVGKARGFHYKFD